MLLRPSLPGAQHLFNDGILLLFVLSVTCNSFLETKEGAAFQKQLQAGGLSRGDLLRLLTKTSSKRRASRAFSLTMEMAEGGPIRAPVSSPLSRTLNKVKGKPYASRVEPRDEDDTEGETKGKDPTIGIKAKKETDLAAEDIASDHVEGPSTEANGTAPPAE